MEMGTDTDRHARTRKQAQCHANVDDDRWPLETRSARKLRHGDEEARDFNAYWRWRWSSADSEIQFDDLQQTTAKIREKNKYAAK